MAVAALGSRRVAALLMALAVATLAAACTVAPPSARPPAASTEPPATDAKMARPQPPRPVRKPTPPTLAALPPMTALPPADSPSTGAPDFDALQGLDETGAIAMLGEPQQRADAPPAQLWRYASHDCELDVYFYLDLQSREMRVLHYEVRNTDDGNQRTQQRCYGELVTDRRAEQAGSADRPR